MTQIKLFIKDVKRMLGKHKIRILHIWLSRTFCGVLMYRLERSLFLLFGKTYGIIRVPFIPIFNLLQAYSNVDIHYKANIKGGLSVLHPSVGCVISGQANIGGKLIPLGKIYFQLEEIAKDKQVVIYCRSGRRSEDAVRLLQEVTGNTSMYNLIGGILAWAAEIDSSVSIDS